MCSYLRTQLLENWFSKVRVWEEFELANGSIRWVCMRRVLISLWHSQFFFFAVVDFGQFVEVLVVMEEKLNLQEAWLKVRCFDGCSFPTEMVVQLRRSSFIVRLEVFSLKDILIRVVTGQLTGFDLSNTGSRCNRPSD